MPQKISKAIGPGNSGSPMLIAVIVALSLAAVFTIFHGGFGLARPTVAANLQPEDMVRSDGDGEIDIVPDAATDRASTTSR